MATTPPQSLTDSARKELHIVREAIHELFASLPPGAQSVTDFATALGFERSLAWKLKQIAASQDVLSIPPFLPGPRAMTRVFDAAAARGVDETVGRQAYSRYRALTAEHAVDHASMQLMVGAQAVRGREVMDRSQRRAAYSANAYFLGVSVELFYDATFVARSAQPGLLDVATVRLSQGLSWVRPHIEWPIGRALSSLQHDGEVQSPGRPLDDSVSEFDVPLMRRFCSPNLPPLVRVETPVGPPRFAVRAGQVGRSGSLNVCVGEFYPGLTDAYALPDAPNATFVVIGRVPTRHAILDLIVEKGVWNDQCPTARMVSTLFDLPSQKQAQFGGGIEMPLTETVVALGSAETAPPAQRVARQREIMQIAASRLGRPLSSFCVYRLEIPFPPLPVAFILSAALPRRPAPADARSSEATGVSAPREADRETAVDPDNSR
jgi:hypothetical protein